MLSPIYSLHKVPTAQRADNALLYEYEVRYLPADAVRQDSHCLKLAQDIYEEHVRKPHENKKEAWEHRAHAQSALGTQPILVRPVHTIDHLRLDDLEIDEISPLNRTKQQRETLEDLYYQRTRLPSLSALGEFRRALAISQRHYPMEVDRKKEQLMVAGTRATSAQLRASRAAGSSRVTKTALNIERQTTGQRVGSSRQSTVRPKQTSRRSTLLTSAPPSTATGGTRSGLSTALTTSTLDLRLSGGEVTDTFLTEPPPRRAETATDRVSFSGAHTAPLLSTIRGVNHMDDKPEIPCIRSIFFTPTGVDGLRLSVYDPQCISSSYGVGVPSSSTLSQPKPGSGLASEATSMSTRAPTLGSDEMRQQLMDLFSSAREPHTESESRPHSRTLRDVDGVSRSVSLNDRATSRSTRPTKTAARNTVTLTKAIREARGRDVIRKTPIHVSGRSFRPGPSSMTSSKQSSEPEYLVEQNYTSLLDDMDPTSIELGVLHAIPCRSWKRGSERNLRTSLVATDSNTTPTGI
ncbi:hypothetical protein GMRT_10603 [Giardia muris]|uniref:Uncharacterized protein n=1 Tax=Giardia muris TaxID=5742 RepID=A0A4Z1ST36_GIAMU|nr:hypothetical protein GMRT_10603 [Giardia muris]|eukprot:TNJ26818.1 hypothetical protein GMRT_10603 [Giardia muris]